MFHTHKSQNILHDKSIKRIDEIQTDFNPNEISIKKMVSAYTELSYIKTTEYYQVRWTVTFNL